MAPLTPCVAVKPGEAEHGHTRTVALYAQERDVVVVRLKMVHRSSIKRYLTLGQRCPRRCSRPFLLSARAALEGSPDT